MSLRRLPWLALTLSLGIHLLFGFCLLGLSGEVDSAPDWSSTLESCVLADETDDSAVEHAIVRPHASVEAGQPDADARAESDGVFSSTVKDLAPRGSAEESSSGEDGETATPGAYAPGSPTRGVHAKDFTYYGIGSKGARVVYVLDRSLSMGLNGAFRQACDEMLNSLERLSADARFQVILYNRHAEPLTVSGSSALLPATTDIKEQVRALVHGRRSEGSTDHMQAMQAALRLHPDTIFLATDGDGLTQQTVDAITRLNKDKATIHVVEVARWFEDHRSKVLKQLAEANGGTYHAVVVRSGGTP